MLFERYKSLLLGSIIELLQRSICEDFWRKLIRKKIKSQLKEKLWYRYWATLVKWERRKFNSTGVWSCGI